MRGPAYTSSEDSALLRKALETRKGGRFLEIGAGNGGTLVELTKRYGLVVGTDTMMPAMADWKDSGANFVLADGASCIRRSAFDLVAFNPPYVPVKAEEDATVGGGEQLEVPKAFLRDSLKVVRRGGEILFLLNNEANLDEFRRICAGKGFDLKAIVTQRVFFEELTAYSAKAIGRGGSHHQVGGAPAETSSRRHPSH